MALRGKGAVALGTLALLVMPGVPARAATPVMIGHAGMLTDLVQQGLAPEMAPEIEVNSVPGGSLKVARDIREGALAADLFGSADATANRILSVGHRVAWYAAFARAEIVLAYSPSPSIPRRALFDAAARGELPWYETLQRRPDLPDVKIGRSNPDEDPSGYYALFVMQLAEGFYDKPGLTAEVLGDDLNPAQVGQAGVPKLVSGAVEAMFTYKNIALANKLPYLALPPEVNLGDPAQADEYGRATYRNSVDGTLEYGKVIRPSLGPVEGAANPEGAEEVLLHFFSNRERLVADAHLEPSELYVGGDPAAVPAELRPFFDLRELQLVVPLRRGECDPDHLGVSGNGAEVTGTTALSRRECQVTVEVRSGETGDRDLTITHRLGDDDRLFVFQRRMDGVVHLDDAVPVKPDFLD